MLTKMKLALAVVAALGGVAGAQGLKDGQKLSHEERKAKILEKYDLNKDGKLDANEKKLMVDDRAASMFEKMDANKDGVVTLDEMKAFNEQRAAARHGKWGHRHGRRGGFRTRTKGALSK